MMKDGTLGVEMSDYHNTNVEKSFYDPTQLGKSEPMLPEFANVIAFYNGKILVLKRTSEDTPILADKYSLPGGKIERCTCGHPQCHCPGETPRQAAMREYYEETGLSCKQDLVKGPKIGRCHYFFYQHVEPDPTIITTPTVSLDEEEHSEYRWMSREEIRESDPSIWIMDLHNRLCQLLTIDS